MRSTKSILIRLAFVLLASGLAASQFIHQSAAAATTKYGPVADGYVIESAPATNYGPSADMYVGAVPAANGYLKFGVSGSKNIVSATLRVYSNSSSTEGVTVKKVADNSWDENSLNFNNAPTMGTTIANPKNLRARDWITVDVSSYVTGSGTYSFGVTSADPGSLDLTARESKNHQPELAVVFSDPTPLPSTVTPTSLPQSTPRPTAPNLPATTPINTSVSGPAATSVPPNTPMPSATNTAANTPTKTSIAVNTPTKTTAPTATSTPANGSLVFYVAANGNDSNPGTSSQPWRTILKATNTLNAGDTAIVLAGTYNEQVNISGLGITLQAEGKVITKAVYISGNSNTLRGFTITDPTSDYGIMTSGSYNWVEGNEIYHTKQDGIWFFGSYNTFRGNYLHDILYSPLVDTHNDCFQTWGWDYGATNILFENNTCVMNVDAASDNQQIFMLERQTTTEVRNLTVRNNVFVTYHPTYCGLDFIRKDGQSEISGITVVNNTIVNMGRTPLREYSGICFDNITNATAVNNLIINFGNTTFWPNRPFGTNYIGVSLGSNLNIHHNAVYNTDGIAPAGPSYPNDVWMKDPKFVNFAGLDFHLQSGSPLINAGYNLGNLVPSDLAGVIRPQGTGFDIGAYEFVTP